MKILTKVLITVLLYTSLLISKEISGTAIINDVLHQRSFKIAPGNNLKVSTEAGDITITPWEQDEVEIKVLGNDRARERMRFSFNADDETVEVTAKRDGSGWSWFTSMKLKFEIMVPSSFNIDASTSGGDVRAGGIDGTIILRTSGGDIWADRCTGSIDVRTSGGDINIFTASSQVYAKTSGGDIELEYAGINKGIELKTSGGDIDIKISADVKANVELSTSGGSVSNSGVTISNATKMSRSKISGEMNGGGEKLIARTSGGDVELMKLD